MMDVIRQIGQVTAMNHRLVAPELLGFLCMRAARRHGVRSNGAVLRSVEATLKVVTLGLFRVGGKD